ncbi:MAG: outer membrane protein [Janthinobacterium lividum]
MRLGTATAVVAVIATSIPMAAHRAAAADMPSYFTAPIADAPNDAPLEFGAGWYLRGDAAFGPEDKPKLLLQSGTPSFDRKGDAIGYAFGAGAGYKFTDWFRTDITADYLDPFHYAENVPCGTGCVRKESADIQRFDGLVNGYVDLGTYAGFTPYVGGGVGIAGTIQDGSVQTGGTAIAKVPSRTDYGFAWAAMAGVSYAVAPHTLLDIGYRYLDLGRTTVSLPPSATVTRNMSAQQVRFGVRYMID